MADDVEIAGEATNFLAVNTFRTSEITEDLYQLRIVVSFHLIGQQIVAVNRVNFDLIGDCQQIIEVGDFRTVRRLAHSSKSFSSSDRSASFAVTED